MGRRKKRGLGNRVGVDTVLDGEMLLLHVGWVVAIGELRIL